MTPNFRVELTSRAEQQLAAIKDRRVQRIIGTCFDRLSQEPGKQGKPLIQELAGYRSLRAVGQRYRIIYRVEASRVTVVVVLIGLRRAGDQRDVYAVAHKLLSSHPQAPKE
ncbi:MAG: type II toxin-antitoxin system RelE family toxin [Chloroflexota bacterium]